MILKKFLHLKLIGWPAAAPSVRGAISVEYAFCMLVAVTLMMGAERLFRNMAMDVVHRFIDMVSQFPNI